MAHTTDADYQNVTLKAPREIVYLDYPPSQLAPKPSDEWTRFVCISDTHTKNFPVPDGDVLLHGGDLTNLGTLLEFRRTMDWLCALPHKIKIIIGGNHDLTLHSDWYEGQWSRWHWRQGKQDVKAIFDLVKGEQAKNSGIVYLQDESYEFKTKEDGRTWSVYGSPWSPEFCDWAFNYAREDAAGLSFVEFVPMPLNRFGISISHSEDLVSKFPKTDILLTHGPVHGIFDRTNHEDNAGCEALRDRFRSDLRPRIHLAGHIHEAHGAYIHTWDPSNNFEPPTVQNDDARVTQSHTIQNNPLDSLDAGDGAAQERPGDEGQTERTVFVNAANWPMGKKTRREGEWAPRHIPFGGPGFQAVVVDLKD